VNSYSIETGKTVSIQIKGLERIAGKIKDAEPRMWMEGAMQAAVSDVKAWVAKYPPKSSANEPSDVLPWYQRGYGTRWRRLDGTTGGSKTSETLGRRWTQRVENHGLRGIAGNNATYVRAVQDEDRQATFHKERGWRTVQDAVREKAPSVVAKLTQAIERILAK
jgi:hypothetical protein